MVRQIGSMAARVLLLLGLYVLVFELQKLVMARSESYRSMLENNVPIWLLINFSTLYLLLLAVFAVRNRLSKQGKKTTLFEAVGFRAIRGRDVFAMFAVAFGCALIFFGLMKLSLLPQFALDQMKAYVQVFGTAEQFIFVLIGVGIAGAFMEEIFFRGLVFNQLRKSLPFIAAYLLQALIYSIFQPNLTISIFAFFLALIYGFVYTRIGSVWSTITMAVGLNTVIVCADKTGLLDRIPQGSDWAYALLLAGMALAVAGLARIAKSAPSAAPSSVPRLQPYLTMAGRLALYVAIYFAVLQPLVYIWYGLLTQIDAIRPWLTDAKNGNWGLVLNDFIAIPIYFFILRRYQERDLIQVCRFRKIPLESIGLIVLLSVFMGVWVTSMAKIPAVAEAFPQFEALFSSLVGGSPVTFFVFLIVHSIYKEVLFRGLVFNELRAVLPLSLAIAGNALVYGLLFFRLDPALTFYGAMGTVIFVSLYVWYRSIWAPIVAEIGLFATYYAVRSLYHHFDIAFNGMMMAWIAGSSLLVPALMYRLWKISSASADRSPPAGQIQLEAGGK